MTNLPTLTGTDKQVAFATDIRDRALKSLVAYTRLGGVSQEQIDAALEAQIFPLLAEATDAARWIEAH